MGKALLLLVVGASMALSTQMFTSQDSENRTARDQRGYEEQTIAREAAVSGFNVAMGDIRSRGTALIDAVQTFGEGSLGRRTASYTAGSFAGSRVTTRAVLTSGHSVRVTSTGQTGYDASTGRYRASYEMHDDYRIPVLKADEASLVNVRFVDSVAGYCSAVFYQAYTVGMAPGTVPPPRLLFSANNSDRRGVQPAYEIVVRPGTQMNFFIGVDQNCSTRTTSMTTCQARTYAQTYTYSPVNFDYVHYALDVPAASLSDIRENPYGFVEQHPTSGQRWRIGWEDIHRSDWDTAASTSALTILQATKSFGYDGTGWPVVNSDGYRRLTDSNSRPDFDDQVVEVSLTPLSSADAQRRLAEDNTEATSCGLPSANPDAGTTTTGTTTTGTTTTGTTTTGTTTTGTGGGTTTTPPAGTTNGAGCSCQGNKKVYIMHRPPGNESNEHRICISENGWLNGHQGAHNDYLICRGS